MSTPKIFTNLEFEYELFMPDLRKLSPGVREHARRFRHILRLLPGMEEAALWQPGTPCDRLTAWGISEVARITEEMPRLEVVREVNDKRFSHRLEHRLGIALPHSSIIGDSETLAREVAACPHDWVLKHPFGVSGRERMLNRVGVLTESVAGWARKLFSRGVELVFEPWLNPRHDYSLHYHIEADATVRFLGRCEMVPDQGGVYRGNLCLPGAVRPTIADDVVAAVAKQGYWGPVSLDAFDGLLEGVAYSRPLVEINARYTFGRLTLEFGRWIPRGWAYAWWHPLRQPQIESPRLTGLVDKAGWYRLPEFADPENATSTWVAAAPSLEALEAMLEAEQVP